VSEINLQSLLVIADKGIVSTTVAGELQSLNSKLHVEMITEAGHGLHYDQPEKFVAVIKSFLSWVL
jgi:pimeloyl-ACP methyl ester carboxylesterase